MRLTPLDRQIIQLLLDEHPVNTWIANRLRVSPSRVANALHSLYELLELQEWGDPRIRLVLWALESGGFERTER